MIKGRRNHYEDLPKLALAALSLLVSGCASADRTLIMNANQFQVVDAPNPGQPYDYKLIFRSVDGTSTYDLDSVRGRLAFTRDLLGKQCPDPSIMKETKTHVGDTVLYPIYQYITEIKCHPSVAS
jgi:hypothetical protein